MTGRIDACYSGHLWLSLERNGHERWAAPSQIRLCGHVQVCHGQLSSGCAWLQGALGPVAHVPAREAALQPDTWPVVCAAGECTLVLEMVVSCVATHVLGPPFPCLS